MERVADFLENPSSGVQVAVLQAEGALLDDHAAHLLAKVLFCNTSPNSLRLAGNNIGDEGASAIASVLEMCTAGILDAALEINSGLRHVSVDAVAVLTASMMAPGAAQLTSLDLCHNELGLEGAQLLVEVLTAQWDGALTHLAFGGNKIGDAGASAFAAMLKHNQRLTSLDISSAHQLP
eukprot:gene5280-6415_t